MEAIARMNFLHAPYQKTGKISNDDLLYTLATFALEPSRWINRYEWRELSDVEMCACGTFWKHIGDAMEISFSELPSSAHGWQDGLHWLNEVKKWSEMVEEKNMLPAHTNRLLADCQLNALLPKWPMRYRHVYKWLALSVLEPRLRWSIM